MNLNENFVTTKYNLNQTHPIQPNSQQYLSYKKYVSIHSEDRDSIKFPSSSNFEIELPETINNISAVRLAHWAFPANYDTFSLQNNNIAMSFKITNTYNPADFGISNPLLEAIYQCLFLSYDESYDINITEGFYSPSQMITELTRKFNEAVTLRITQYLTDNAALTYLLSSFSGYNRFEIVYHDVKQNIWFGNVSDTFSILNSVVFLKSQNSVNLLCSARIGTVLPEYTNWGLPFNLGFNRNDVTSESADTLPRFYYGDYNTGDDGYWLQPDPLLVGSIVTYLECPFKINLMGPAYFYMEIDGLNNIDETSPFYVSELTKHTNETNGRVNAAFAKMSIPTTPVSQWFDGNQIPYYYFTPPADRIRRLKIKIRYHDGQLVNFNTFPYSFLLEFDVLNPSILRTGKVGKADVNLV